MLDDLARCAIRTGNKSVVQRRSFIVKVHEFKFVIVGKLTTLSKVFQDVAVQERQEDFNQMTSPLVPI